MSLKNDETKINEHAKEISYNYKRNEAELISALQEVEQFKIHYKLGYSSLQKYAEEELKLDEGVAAILIRLARKSREVPELKQAIESGSITASKGARIAGVIKPENKEVWLTKASTLSKAKLEIEVAKALPQQLPKKEVVRRSSAETVRLHLDVSNELMEKLNRILNLESSRKKKNVKLEEALAELANRYFEKVDRASKKKQPRAKQSNKSHKKSAPASESKIVTVPGHSPTAPFFLITETPHTIPHVRKQLRPSLKREVLQKQNHRCQYKVGNRICGAERFLHLHHIIPVSEGGTNSFENLMLLCRAHHALHHDEEKSTNPHSKAI